MSEQMCDGCSKCCEYMAMEIDAPTDLEDFENIRWYLLHKNVRVYLVDNSEEDDDEDFIEETDEDESEYSEELDDENSEEYEDSEEDELLQESADSEDDDSEDESDYKWFIQFMSPCKELDSEGLCKIYERRPSICREHSSETCEICDGDSEEDISFDDPDVFWRWVEENYDFKSDEELETFKNEGLLYSDNEEKFL